MKFQDRSTNKSVRSRSRYRQGCFLLLAALLLCVLRGQARAEEKKPFVPEFKFKIKVLQDVQVNPEHTALNRDGIIKNGQLIVEPEGSFVLKKGTIIESTDDQGEGACDIWIGAKKYSGGCVWLEGYTDQQTEYFQVLNSKPSKPGR